MANKDNMETRIKLDICKEDFVSNVGDDLFHSSFFEGAKSDAPELLLVIPIIVFEVWKSLEKMSRMQEFINNMAATAVQPDKEEE